MKILLICEFFPTSRQGDFTGGVEASCYYLAQELAKRHEVTVICSYTQDSKRESVIDGVKVLRVGILRKYTTKISPGRTLFLLAAIIKGLSIDADIVQGTNFINQIDAYIIGKLKKIPIVFWTPDVWLGKWVFNMQSRAAAIGEVLERFVLSRRDVNYIAISRVVKTKMIQAGIPNKLITVIYPGVDIKAIDKVVESKSRFPAIVTISRLVKYKNIDILIKATALLKTKIPLVRTVIIGQGPEKNKLERLTRSLNISNNVEFTGHIKSHNEVVSILKKSTLFCLPSRVEGFGMASMEALSCGVPLILPDTSLNHEITQDKGVLFFNPDDSQDLAARIAELLKDKKLQKKLQLNGKKIVRQYSKQKIARHTERLYESLCSN